MHADIPHTWPHACTHILPHTVSCMYTYPAHSPRYTHQCHMYTEHTVLATCTHTKCIPPYTTRHAYIEILLSISSLNKSKRCPQGTELVFWNNFHMPPIFKVIKREEPSCNKIKKLKCLEIKTFQNVHKTFMGKIINHIERLRSGDTHHGYEQKDWH